MTVEIRFRGFAVSDALREHILRRIHGNLNRFKGQIGSVLVRIGDVNGPRGGVDKRCQVTVRGPALRPTQIEELNASAYAAVDLAMERAGQSVARELGRMRSIGRAATPMSAS